MNQYIKKLSKKLVVYFMFLPSIYDFTAAYFDFDIKLPTEIAIAIAIVFFFIASYSVWKDENNEKLKLDLLLRGKIIELSKEAEILLKEATLDKNQTICFFKSPARIELQTNDNNFIKDNNPRTETKWEEALKELLDNELINTDDEKYYKVSGKGYDYIDNSNN